MDGRLTALMIVLVLLLLLVGLVYYIYMIIRSRIRDFSRRVFGTSSLAEGLEQLETEAEITPKSVSSATGLLLPSIMKDFPEFHYDEMRARAENVLVSYLQSIDAGNSALLAEGTKELKEKLQMYIRMQKEQGREEHFESIRIHKTEINQYRRTAGRCSIIMQSAVEYIHYVSGSKGLVKGKKEQLVQSKYNVELIYIQDREQVENLGDAGLGLNCPNCGAPISRLGARKCDYCDTPIVEFNIRIWNFSDVKECP